MKVEKWAFVAGGFGFLGQYIVWGLIRRGYHVALGTSKRTDIKVDQRLSQFVNFNQSANSVFKLSDRDLNNIHIIECDISKNNLDLSERDRTWLDQRTFSQVWNCAAYMKYDAETYQKSYEINVGGTSNLLNFASAQPQCTYYHVSTAYIGGKDFCDGSLLKEQIYKNKNGYFNSYDTTKAYAEKKIVSYCHSQKFLSYAIFRPTIIIGDSETGFTSSVAGFYEYLQALNRLKKYIKGKTVYHFCDKHSLLHIIPVDRCAEAMLALMPVISLKNLPIYTIADAHPITLGKMASILSDIFSSNLVCASTPPSDEQNYEKLLRLFTRRNQIFSKHSFNFCCEQTYSLIGKSICSDWSKDYDFFNLINEGLNNLLQM